MQRNRASWDILQYILNVRSESFKVTDVDASHKLTYIQCGPKDWTSSVFSSWFPCLIGILEPIFIAVPSNSDLAMGEGKGRHVPTLPQLCGSWDLRKYNVLRGETDGLSRVCLSIADCDAYLASMGFSPDLLSGSASGIRCGLPTPIPSVRLCTHPTFKLWLHYCCQNS